MDATRREFLGSGALAAAGGLLAGAAGFVGRPQPAAAVEAVHKAGGGSKLKLALAGYSFRKFLDLKAPKESRWSIYDFLDKAAELGSDGVELTEYYFEKPITAEYISKIKRKAHLVGQTIMGSPIGNVFTHPAGEARDKQIEHVRNWIDVSADLGSPQIRIFAGTTPKGMTDEQARKNVVECIESLCGHAEKRGVFLALENHGGVVATPEGLLEILNAVKCPWVGVNLDTGNFHTADPYADLAKVAPYAVTVQYKVEMFPGNKREPADPARVVKILKDAGYRGWVALEYEAAEDPISAVPKHLEILRKAL